MLDLSNSNEKNISSSFSLVISVDLHSAFENTHNEQSRKEKKRKRKIKITKENQHHQKKKKQSSKRAINC